MRSFWLRRIAVLLLCCPGLVLAQAFPNKPIKVLVPFPAGGTVDFFARTLAPKLSDPWCVDEERGDRSLP